MSINPLYPGYVPDDKGYPGTPIRRPFTPSPEGSYDIDAVVKYLNGYFDELSENTLFPLNQLKEEITNTMKLYPGTTLTGSEIIPDEYAMDIEEGAGVNFAVNINPIDWATKPKEMATDLGNTIVRATTGVDIKKLAKGDFSGAINFSDLDTFTEQKKIWEPLIRGNKKGPAIESGFLGGRIAASIGGDGGAAPVQLKGRGPIYLDQTKKTKVISLGQSFDPEKQTELATDALEAAGEDFIKFTGKYKAIKYRNSSMRSLEQSFIHAAVVERDNLAKKGMSFDSDFESKIDYFRNSDTVGTYMYSVNDKLGDIKENISKHQVKALGLKTGLGVIPGDDLNKVISDIEALRKIRSSPQDTSGIIEQQLQSIENIRTGMPKANPKYERLFNAQIKEYENYLTDLQGYLHTIDVSKLTPKQLDSIAGKLGGLSNKLSTRNFGGGVYDRFLSRSFDNFIAYDKTLDRMEGTRLLRRYGRVARQKFDGAAMTDFIDLLEGGPTELLDTYVVPRIRDYLQNRILPNTWIKKKILDPTNSFGLIYDKDKEIKFTIDPVTKLPIYGKESRFLSRNIFQVEINKKRFKVDGGVHFDPIIEIGQLVREKGISDAALLALLNGNFSSKALNELNLKLKVEDFDKYEKKLEYFRNWLQNSENAKKLGIKMIKDPKTGKFIIDPGKENVAKLRSLVDQVTERNINPQLVNATWSHVGKLQILVEKLNKIQNAIYKRIGKFYAPIEKLKQAFAAGAAGWLTGVIAGATGGVGAAIAVPLKKILQYTIKKATDFVENIVKGAMKGDLGLAFRELENSLWKMAKIFIAILAAPLFLILFITTIFFGSFFTTVSPVEPTREVHPNLIGGFYGINMGFGGWDETIIDPNVEPIAELQCLKFISDTSVVAGEGCAGSNSVVAADECYQIKEWPEPQYSNLLAAAQNVAGSGDFLTKMCECRGNSNLYILWGENTNKDSGTCGAAATNYIVFSKCSFSDEGFNTYLFAHELGHKLISCTQSAFRDAVNCQKNRGLSTGTGSYFLAVCPDWSNQCFKEIYFTDSGQPINDPNCYLTREKETHSEVIAHYISYVKHCGMPGESDFWNTYYPCYRDFVEQYVIGESWNK